MEPELEMEPAEEPELAPVMKKGLEAVAAPLPPKLGLGLALEPALEEESALEQQERPPESLQHQPNDPQEEQH